ncbi:MAG: hypothetical protein JW908_06995 [Anaerolineales bacterium]|nr:hypothetical protein [Anaerolineales bacterium]
MQENTKFPLSTKRFILGIVLSALSGVLLLLAFPPYGFWMLAWIACVPYRFAQHRLLPMKWSSLAETTASLIWLGPFMARLFGTEFGPIFTYLGVLIAILTFFLSKDRWFHELTGYRWFILQGIVAWVGFEMIRATFIPLVATSAFIGYTQASQAWMIQPVSLFSVYGLNLLIMLVNFAITQMIMSWYDQHWQPEFKEMIDRKHTRNWLIASGVIFLAWIGTSLFILTTTKEMPKVRVASLQPNYQKPAFQDDNLTSKMRLDDFAGWVRDVAQEGAKIVVTPEMAFNFDPRVEFTDELRALTKETDVYLFINYTVANENEPFRNETILLSPSGEFFSPAYAKNHNSPGEPLSPTAGVFPVYDTPLGKLAAMICHDANYTDIARKLTRNGSQLVAVGFNEFGLFGEQFWTNVTFRAVENRTAMIIAARATGSAIIDAQGHQIALDITPEKQVVLVGDITLGNDNAPYTNIGDVLGWVSLAAFIGFMIYQSIIEKRAKKEKVIES